MDLRKPLAALTLVTLGLFSTPARADKTLWLVRPLYPGQETLIDRTEKALDKLMPGDARQDAVIGHKELVASLKGKGGGELPCFAVDVRCADPIDPFVSSLGFDRIVLIQGGQDEAGFKYRVVSYEPKVGKVNPATASNANLEKALLGAVAKVVPAASTLEVKSNPAGATVFVDDVKVGVTPLTTQVLPGERVIRFDLKLHQPIEESIIIPIRGTASLEKSLEKVAARIVITASPPGTEISIDGTLIGKDKVDRGIVPGDHTIRLTAENHKAFEQTISVKADQQYALDKTLEPVPGTAVIVKQVDPNDPTKQIAVVVRNDPPPPPPKPMTTEDLIYERKSYFSASFEVAQLTGANLVSRRLDTNAFGRTTQFFSNGRGAMPTLIGASAEYGTFGKYFGITVFGLGYLTTIDTFQMAVGYEPGQVRELFAGTPGPTSIEKLSVSIGTIRLLHPQFRIVFWRFQLGLQVGLEVRAGQISGADEGNSGTTSYKDGFLITDLMLTGKLNVRFFVAEGFFLHLQGQYTQYLIGWTATDESTKTYHSASTLGGALGVGYAF